MPVAGKIFKLTEKISLEEIAEKLSRYKREYEHLETGMKLLTEIKDLALENNILSASFCEDIVIYKKFRGEIKPIPITLENKFVFIDVEKAVLLFIVAKKLRANNVANKLSEIIFLEQGRIVEAEISHETLRALHESDPESSKVIFFDNVDIPNVDKLSLYGSALANTSLYSEYLKHGKVWYVVFYSSKHNITIGLTRNCVVTVFNPIDEESFLEFALKEVIPLVRI